MKEIDLDTGGVRTLTSYDNVVFTMAYDHEERYLYVPIYSPGYIAR